ncbi:hypothetical protein HOC06_00055, partial [Candidatus Woesearchaeota archaeon]|nr:hypothetical protein [Candidatus Woesearchaeota archaeon]
IGITLLSLGLVWVKTIFDNLQGTTVDAFDQVDAAIGELGTINSPLTITPDKIRVEQNGAKSVDVIIANFEGEDLVFTARAESVPKEDGSNKIKCLFLDTFKVDSKEYTLSSGEQATLSLIADDKNSPLDFYSCNVIIEGLGSSSLLIEIVMKE